MDRKPAGEDDDAADDLERRRRLADQPPPDERGGDWLDVGEDAVLVGGQPANGKDHQRQRDKALDQPDRAEPDEIGRAQRERAPRHQRGQAQRRHRELMEGAAERPHLGWDRPIADDDHSIGESRERSEQQAASLERPPTQILTDDANKADEGGEDEDCRRHAKTLAQDDAGEDDGHQRPGVEEKPGFGQ